LAFGGEDFKHALLLGGRLGRFLPIFVIVVIVVVIECEAAVIVVRHQATGGAPVLGRLGYYLHL